MLVGRSILAPVTALIVGVLSFMIVNVFIEPDHRVGETCRDRVIALKVSNGCPSGTFIEMQPNGTHIACHCVQPLNVIMYMPLAPETEAPGLELPGDPAPTSTSL